MISLEIVWGQVVYGDPSVIGDFFDVCAWERLNRRWFAESLGMYFEKMLPSCYSFNGSKLGISVTLSYNLWELNGALKTTHAKTCKEDLHLPEEQVSQVR